MSCMETSFVFEDSGPQKTESNMAVAVIWDEKERKEKWVGIVKGRRGI